jgi:hypothetical protein
MRYTLKWFSKNARTAAAVLPSTCAAALHGACHVACFVGDARSARQPTRNAGHAASTRSSRQPGNASKLAGVNAARAGGASGGTTRGATWQAATSNATIGQATRNRTVDERTMEWIYLEAAIALALLVAIVWWTMAARHKPDRGKSRDK